MYGGKMKVRFRHDNKEFDGIPKMEELYVNTDNELYAVFWERVRNLLHSKYGLIA